MKIKDLKNYGIPSYILNILEKHSSPYLLPLQEDAVKNYGILDYNKNQNLLIIAPTSSGKSFIGEMAALSHVTHHKKIIYLVPLRSPAEEKYRHFKNLYNSHGLKTVISTRNRREEDYRIIRGTYKIAVMAYEKFNYFLLKYPNFLDDVSLVIIDEMQVINNPKWGPLLEDIIEHLRKKDLTDLRIIGLSAFIENPKALLKWFPPQTQTLISCQYPVELRKGIVRDGTFKYITSHKKNICRKEVFFKPNSVRDNCFEDYLLETVRYLISQGEPTLIYFATCTETRQWAEWLASCLESPPASSALKDLVKMEETLSRDELLKLLEKGIAYHNQDLSYEERNLVETYLKKGEIKIICATPILETGINLPSKNVIIPLDKIHNDDEDYIHNYRTSITFADIENMGGRAGILNIEKNGNSTQKKHKFGRVIFLAYSPLSETAFKNLYFKFSKNNNPNKHNDNTPAKYLLKKENNSNLSLTPSGTLIAAKRIKVETYLFLKNWINYTNKGEISNLEILYLLSQTPDGKELSIPFYHPSTNDYKKERHKCDREEIHAERILHLIFQQNEQDKKLYQNKILLKNCKQDEVFSLPEHLSFKKTLLLYDWITGIKNVKTIEQEFNLYQGTIYRLGESFSWLADSLAAIAENSNWKKKRKEDLNQIKLLSNRLIEGVEEEGLDLANLYIPGLSRYYIKKLLQAGYNNKQCLQELSEEELSKILPDMLAKRIKNDFPALPPSSSSSPSCRNYTNLGISLNTNDQRLTTISPCTSQPESSLSSPPPRRGRTKVGVSLNTNDQRPTTILQISLLRPDRIIFMGKKIELTATEFSLIHFLAQHPEQAMSYDELLNKFWKDEEDAIYNRVSFHISKIRRTILKTIGENKTNRERLKNIFAVIPRRGVMLNLKTEEIKIN